MNTKVESQSSALDVVKIVAAVLIVLGAIVAYYQFADLSRLIRVPGLIVAVALAAVVALQTEQGRTLAGFIREAHIEVRKVVWPTRQETIQTTLVVVAVVVVAALLLWAFDWLLGGLIRYIID
jgi:preprotein translocase subunit SecE